VANAGRRGVRSQFNDIIMPKFVELTAMEDKSKVAIDVDLITDLVPVVGKSTGTVLVLNGVEDVKVVDPFEVVAQQVEIGELTEEA
jgi:hypothetical protein